VYGSRVYVATESDTIYSLDAATGAVVWKAHVATPESSGTAPCGDIGPTIGITGTPVIDPAANRIYAVAAVAGSGGSVTHQLFAQGNRVLAGYGGNDGDCASYHGWLVSVSTTGGAKTSFEADPSAGNHGGAIWGAGAGPALDANGNVWVATGNGFGGSTFDFSESVVHLGPSMSLVSPGSYWAPPNWKTLDNTDADIGSSEPVLLPNNLILESGKDGNAYLINGVARALVPGEIKCCDDFRAKSDYFGLKTIGFRLVALSFKVGPHAGGCAGAQTPELREVEVRAVASPDLLAVPPAEPDTNVDRAAKRSPLSGAHEFQAIVLHEHRLEEIRLATTSEIADDSASGNVVARDLQTDLHQAIEGSEDSSWLPPRLLRSSDAALFPA